jgi:hypothetical protein
MMPPLKVGSIWQKPLLDCNQPTFASPVVSFKSKQQALILGHAVPMPVVVRTRAYDQQFYAEIDAIAWSELPDEEVLAAAQAAKADLGF